MYHGCVFVSLLLLIGVEIIHVIHEMKTKVLNVLP